jgi:hypothetical protein
MARPSQFFFGALVAFGCRAVAAMPRKKRTFFSQPASAAAAAHWRCRMAPDFGTLRRVGADHPAGLRKDLQHLCEKCWGWQVSLFMLMLKS